MLFKNTFNNINKFNLFKKLCPKKCGKFCVYGENYNNFKYYRVFKFSSL